MAGYDGTIRIDSSIDPKGFNAGLKTIVGSLGKMAVAMGAAFSVAALVGFGKTAVSEASNMAAALTGLQSVVLGTGKSFSEAKKFIDDYIRDGLVPATNAMTAYKNLAARGYDTQQIEQVLKALKDSAAFGRQASLTMGQAIQGATEGLKNENSILVDNAGVTKNVSVMWKEYAESIGTTVGMLTKAQKIQAEVNGILEETRFQTGDAAKMSGQFAGKMAAISASFTNFKVAVGNTIIPVVTKILPLIQAALDKLTIFFNKASQIMSALFGVEIGAGVAGMEDMATNTDAAADAQNDLADGIDKANKAAKGALAAFDELNVLQQPEETAAPETAAAKMPLEIEPIVSDEISPEVQSAVDKIRSKLAELFEPLRGPLARLQETLSPMWGWLKDEVLKPLSEWVMNEFLPRFFELLGGALDLLNTILVALQPAWQWFWDNVLQPAFEWTGNKILEFLDWLILKVKDLNTTIQEHPETVKKWSDQINLAGNGILAMLGPLGWIIILLKELAKRFGEFGFSWDAIADLASDAWAFIVQVWGIAWDWFSKNVVTPIKTWFGDLWAKIKTWGEDAWKKIEEIWAGVSDWFNKTVIEPIKTWFAGIPRAIGGFFSNAWTEVTKIWGNVEKWFQENVTSKIEGAFESVSKFANEHFSAAFSGLADGVKNAFNAVIDLLNGFLTAFTQGVNAMVAGINALSVKVPDGVPIYGGQTWGFNLQPVAAPQIPRLATGAYVPAHANMLAMIGEGSRPEIVAPDEKIRQIIREELGGNSGDMTITMPVYLDSEKIYEGQQRVSRRRGPSLITSGASA